MSRPLVPLGQFVLKVHSRCDLACDHCYVYEAADQSWRGRPMVISQEVIAQAAQRIAEHAAAACAAGRAGHPARRGAIAGGRARLRRIITDAARGAGWCRRLDLRIHTNGVLLDERFLRAFRRARVKVGISLDGDRAANDRHRRYADGRSSYDQVIRAIGLLRQRPFPGSVRRAAVHHRRRQRPARRLRVADGPAAAADRFPAAPRHLGPPASPPAGLGYRVRATG